MVFVVDSFIPFFSFNTTCHMNHPVNNTIAIENKIVHVVISFCQSVIQAAVSLQTINPDSISFSSCGAIPLFQPNELVLKEIEVDVG